MSFHHYILTPEWNERRFSKWMSQEAIEAFESQRKSPVDETLKNILNALYYVAVILAQLSAFIMRNIGLH